MSDSSTTCDQQQKIPQEGIEPIGVNSIAIALWGAVSIAIVLGTMFFAVAITHEIERNLNQTRVIGAVNTAAKDTILAQQGILTSYAPPASEGKPFRIPISLAKQLVLNELQSQQ